MSGIELREDLIFDVGLHIGQDSAFYLAKGYRVVAVDANAALCEAAAKRFCSEVESGRLTVVNAAITSAQGVVDFYLNANAEWGTIQLDWAERNARQLHSPTTAIVRVRTVTLRSLFEEYGVPYYLKVDIEGADTLGLESLIGFPLCPRFLSLESEKRSWQKLRREFDLLMTLGYTRFKVVNQRFVPRQRPPRPPREGMYVNTVFPLGSSGLFGEEAPGRWLTRRTALIKYAYIFARYRVYGDYGVFNRDSGAGRMMVRALSALFGRAAWFDTHAKR